VHVSVLCVDADELETASCSCSIGQHHFVLNQLNIKAIRLALICYLSMASVLQQPASSASHKVGGC